VRDATDEQRPVIGYSG